MTLTGQVGDGQSTAALSTYFNLFRNLVCRTKVHFVLITGRFGDIASPANTRLHPPECKL
jgi:hypothetical protein